MEITPKLPSFVLSRGEVVELGPVGPIILWMKPCTKPCCPA